MAYNKLSSEEEKIISGRGTEPPFSGQYDDFYEKGGYLCRRCDAGLYDSKDKFNARCGWPSFDDELPGAVIKRLDSDGQRTEIICANCGAHLGHVFIGEKLTSKDARHCVNSLSLRFIPLDFKKGEPAEAYLAGGCFWCLDASYRGLKGITEVISGYAGGQKDRPTYGEVSAGTTGHAETVKITYDPQKISFRRILEIFFTVHDPTTLNRQGNDMGEQYRSAIFFKTWRQREEAFGAISKLADEKIYSRSIVTEVKPMVKFYPAEEYHQDYFNKHPENAYCQTVIAPKLEKLKRESNKS